MHALASTHPRGSLEARIAHLRYRCAISYAKVLSGVRVARYDMLCTCGGPYTHWHAAHRAFTSLHWLCSSSRGISILASVYVLIPYQRAPSPSLGPRRRAWSEEREACLLWRLVTDSIELRRSDPNSPHHLTGTGERHDKPHLFRASSITRRISSDYLLSMETPHMARTLGKNALHDAL